MKKSIKKLAIFVTTMTIAGTSCQMKICKDKSKEYSNKVDKYASNFESDDFLIAAHRGFSSKYVENTYDAIDKSYDEKYIDYIEIDARLTKDKKMVLSHEDKLLTTDYQIMNISNSTLEELINTKFIYNDICLPSHYSSFFDDTSGYIIRERNQNLNNQEYGLLSLREGLSLCRNKKILLDLKFENNTADFIETLNEELKDIDISNITFQSLDLDSLLYLQKTCPNYNCLALIRKDDDLDYIDSFQNIRVRKNLISQKRVLQAIDEGKNLAIWTIDSAKEIDEIANLLKDDYKSIVYITNYPDVVATELKILEKEKENSSLH